MKRAFLLSLLLLSASSFASNTFSLGGEPSSLEFEKSGYSDVFKQFVTEDVGRFLAPFGSITNMLDVSIFQTNASATVSLAYRDWYPSEFVSNLSVSRDDNAFVFHMNAILSERYETIYDNFSAISNQVGQLFALLTSIADNTITNRTDSEMISLVFIPEGSTASTTFQETRAFFQELHELDHLTCSLLDFSEENVLGETNLIAGAKTMVTDEAEVRFATILWIYRNGTWKFYHPSVWETVPLGD